MKWQKLGKIFDPSEHQLSQGCTRFAKSPQALVFDDYVRIYFCAQKKTENGKYLSVPQYVDFDKQFKNILKISDSEPVIELGGLGHFDEHGIFPLNVLRKDDKILGYTSGWSRRVSVSIDMAIGLATSNDGEYFTKYGAGGPVMTANINEANLVGDPFVLHFDGLYHMWYIFGGVWRVREKGDAPERIYKIAYASSEGGIKWKRNGVQIIPDAINDEAQALPTVAYWQGKFHMYFCYRSAFDFRENSANAYRIGYAYSQDGVSWIRDDLACGIDVTAGSWDSDMMCYPNIFKCDDSLYMLYNGNRFGLHGFGLAKLMS